MQLHIATCLSMALVFGNIAADPLEDRKKPELVMDDIEGLSAQRFLINGAEMIHYLSPRVIIYKRQGGIDEALHDFYALKPTNVEKWNTMDGTEIKGIIGKHHLILTKNRTKFPYISITRFEPGKDPEYNFYMKVFAYMDDLQEP